VDDDPEDLHLVTRMLEKETRLHVTTACGGKAGLEAMQAQRPDAVIMDLFMPDCNGLEILEVMRADPVLRHTPVIVLTGADLTPEQHQQLTDFGSGVLSKGFLHDKDLMVVLEEALRKFHPAEED
jgi:CheY-like chemotaxis protein